MLRLGVFSSISSIQNKTIELVIARNVLLELFQVKAPYGISTDSMLVVVAILVGLVVTLIKHLAQTKSSVFRTS